MLFINVPPLVDLVRFQIRSSSNIDWATGGWELMNETFWHEISKFIMDKYMEVMYNMGIPQQGIKRKRVIERVY